jgi:hypothetical protein
VSDTGDRLRQAPDKSSAIGDFAFMVKVDLRYVNHDNLQLLAKQGSEIRPLAARFPSTALTPARGRKLKFLGVAMEQTKRGTTQPTPTFRSEIAA